MQLWNIQFTSSKNPKLIGKLSQQKAWRKNKLQKKLVPSRVVSLGHLNLFLLIKICPKRQNSRNQQASTGGGGGVLSVLSPGFLLSILISRSSRVGSTSCWFLVGISYLSLELGIGTECKWLSHIYRFFTAKVCRKGCSTIGTSQCNWYVQLVDEDIYTNIISKKNCSGAIWLKEV